MKILSENISNNIMKKLNESWSNEFGVDLTSDEESTLDDIMNRDYDLEIDYLDDDEKEEYIKVANSIRKLGPEEAYIDVDEEVKEKAKENHLDADLLAYIYLSQYKH
jgi:CRISPR/Cas system-associated protein Cas5 (RAMP superfamily)